MSKEGIMQILETSTQRLGDLKQQVEELVVFFSAICEGINQTVDHYVEAFLRPIINGITEGKTKDEVESLRLGRMSKKVSTLLLPLVQCPHFTDLERHSASWVQPSSFNVVFPR